MVRYGEAEARAGSLPQRTIFCPISRNDVNSCAFCVAISTFSFKKRSLSD
jgi:hypothetical protein